MTAGYPSLYPFSAVVGLGDLRLALLLNAVSPAIGGVLVRGEKGTAKSTVVRGLAALLPGVAVVEGCRFSCDPAAPDPGCPDGPHPTSTTSTTSTSGSTSGSGTDTGTDARTGTGPGPVVAVARPARLVELPVGASEDRLTGSLDIERALTAGVRAYEPGLLATAHRGVLYVDEVNLLHDHLVDLLLDAAAMGTCYVEREGVSVRHAARFLLVGTMNPEEGELRPQLLDRFGLTVEVTASRDPEQRAEVVRRRLSFEADPAGFAAAWQPADAALAARIAVARQRLHGVVLPDAEVLRIARVCTAFDVDGLRADLVIARAAIAHAAWEGRAVVTADDVRQVAALALSHRRRRDPFGEPHLDTGRLDEALDEPDPGGPDPGGSGGPDGSDGSDGSGGSDGRGGPGSGPGGAAPPAGMDGASDGSGAGAGDRDRAGQGARQGSDQDAGQTPDQTPDQAPVPAGATYRPRLLSVPGLGAGAAGRRSRAQTSTGRVVGARRPAARGAGHPGGRVPHTGPHTGPQRGPLHLAATLHAAAPHQVARGRTGPGLVLRPGDLREAVREGRETNLVLFAVDASGSMAARQRMQAVKGAVLSLLLDAYQRRDTVGLVTFRGEGARVALPPTASVDVAAAHLRTLPTGGRTPLHAGLATAAEVLRLARLRDPARRTLLVVVTDGRHTTGPSPDRAAALLRAAGTASVVVDCEAGPVRLGLAGRLAAALGGTTLRLDQVESHTLAAVVRSRRIA